MLFHIAFNGNIILKRSGTSQEIHLFILLLGKMIHSMVAHLDAVTSLAVDPNGIYLMSGSKGLLILYVLWIFHLCSGFFIYDAFNCLTKI